MILKLFFIFLCWLHVPVRPQNASGVQSNDVLDKMLAPSTAEVEESTSAMFDEYWQRVLEQNPELATTLGDKRFEDRLTCYSLECYESRKAMMTEFLERANQLLPVSVEGSETHSNLQLFITNLHFKLGDLMSGSYLFPVSMLFTPQMALTYLLKYTDLNDEKQYWNLIARYRAFPKQIDEQIELLNEGIRTNFTLSERSLFSESDVWNADLEDSLFYKPFRNLSGGIPADVKTTIQQNATDAVMNYVIPALRKMDDFINNEYRLHVRPDIGVGTLPNGRVFYQQQLSYHLTDTSVTPEDIHRMGLMEVERISKEMDEVIHLLGFNLTHNEFADKTRLDEALHFESEEVALDMYRDVLENKIAPKLPLLFKKVPTKKLTVENVPRELSSGAGVQAFYMRPSADNSTPGTFFLDTSNPHNLPKYEVVTLAMHEGNPGHHFQHAYIMEEDDIPEFRKYGVDSNAFVEGWGLYAEYLGYELDLYDDLYMRYGHLSYEIFRACRMVVDTGMHVMGWSRQQAIDYMMSNSAASQDNIETEVDRYITWPGQACAYKYGEMKIIAMRRKAESILGPSFDVREFHDIILRNSGPLELVEQHVDRYIDANRHDTNLASE